MGNVTTTTTPLTYIKTENGVPFYNIGTQTINGTKELLQNSFVKSKALGDVYQIQLGIRYIFN